MSIFKTLNFNDIEVGSVQSVDEMTIVPILGSDRGVVAKPDSLAFKQTTYLLNITNLAVSHTTCDI